MIARRRIASFAGFAALLVALSGLAACGSSGDKNTLTMYSRTDRADPRSRRQAVRVIAYGPKVKASELPDSPLELVEPKWKGRVGWPPTNASLQGYITALRLVEGEDVAKTWLEGMVANDVQVYDSNIPVRDAIAKGEIDLGLINHYYVAEAQAEDPDYPVKVHFPPKDLGSLINTAGLGVLASTEHKDQALRFVRQMLSKQTQRYFADSSKEYPLVAGVPAPKELTPIGDIPAPKIDLAKLGDLQGTLKLMRETGAL